MNLSFSTCQSSKKNSTNPIGAIDLIKSGVDNLGPYSHLVDDICKKSCFSNFVIDPLLGAMTIRLPITWLNKLNLSQESKLN